MPKSEMNTRPYNKEEKKKAESKKKTEARLRKLEKEQGMSGKLAQFAGADGAEYKSASITLGDSYSSPGKSSQSQRQIRKYMDDEEAKNLRRKRQSGKSRTSKSGYANYPNVKPSKVKDK